MLLFVATVTNADDHADGFLLPCSVQCQDSRKCEEWFIRKRGKKGDQAWIVSSRCLFCWSLYWRWWFLILSWLTLVLYWCYFTGGHDAGSVVGGVGSDGLMVVMVMLLVLWWWWWECVRLRKSRSVGEADPGNPSTTSLSIFYSSLFQIQLHVCQYQDIFPSPIKFSDEPVCFLNVFIPFSFLLYVVAFIGYVQWSSCVHLGALRVPHKCDQSPCNVFLLGPHCRYLCTFCFFHLAWMTLLFHCVLYIFVLYNVVGPDIMGLPCCAAQCCTDSPGHITVGVDWFQPLVVPGQTAIITLRSCCYCSWQSKRTMIGCCISEEC